MNRTERYLKLQIVEYPVPVQDKLRKSEAIYLGNEEFKDYENFYVVLPNAVETDNWINDCYYDFKLNKHVAVVRILEKHKERLPHFWAGDYTLLYTDAELSKLGVGPKMGNMVNLVYHTLKNTEIGKRQMKDLLVKYKYVDTKRFHDWETYLPEKSDFPPSKKQEILHFS